MKISFILIIVRAFGPLAYLVGLFGIDRQSIAGLKKEHEGTIDTVQLVVSTIGG